MAMVRLYISVNRPHAHGLAGPAGPRLVRFNAERGACAIDEVVARMYPSPHERQRSQVNIKSCDTGPVAEHERIESARQVVLRCAPSEDQNAVGGAADAIATVEGRHSNRMQRAGHDRK